MPFSFSSLIRLLVLMAVITTIVAVGLARLQPTVPSNRSVHVSRYSNINEFFLPNVADRTPIWLDQETGRMAPFPLEDGDVLESASCSPWVNEKGQSQVVGRWLNRTKEGPLSISKDFGIARYTFPGGQKLDHISTEIVPVGPPCWYPGTQARILFAAGDGMLYHYAFEPEPWVTASADSVGDRDLNPWPVVWRCPKPGSGPLAFSDVCWPEDPRLGGCLVSSIREQTLDGAGSGVHSINSLWWLKLNFAGTEIVDIGRLLISNDAERDSNHRNPTVGTLPDGRLVLAYLRQRKGDAGWEVRLSPIELDSERHVPKALVTESILVASKCLPSSPTFSADGRWLNILNGPDSKDCSASRISISGLFSRSK